MKLSEAMMIGSVMIKWVAGTRDNEEGGGCALGMADKAVGRNCSTLYAWSIKPNHYLLPCDCKGDELLLGNCMNGFAKPHIESTAQGVITHLFNYHVMTKGDWTLERLVDWVHSIEPVETIEDQPEAEAEEAVNAKETI